MKYLLGVDATVPSGLTGFSLNVKVDQEKNGKEGSEEDGEVGAELNLEGEGL